MSAAEEILEWSSNRPLWQRDALRRLVSRGELNDSDLAEFVLIAKEQHGLVDPSSPAPTAVPLAADHLPTSATGEPVSLGAIKNVENVNALAPDQELAFQSQGLTVVYGDNATGKSGYVRILRKLCRARAADTPILPNVFGPPTDDPARATVRYFTGSTPADFSWEEGTPSPDDLASVSIFDSPSAAVYVSRTHDVAYVPFGLDLLTKLAELCDRVAIKLQEQIAADSSQLDPVPQHLAETPSGLWLTCITENTSDQETDHHATFSAEDAEEREHLREVLSEQNPEQRAAELEGKGGRFERLRDRLLTISQIVTTMGIERFKGAHRELRDAKSTSALAAAQRFGALPIPIVASEAWERLWEAAQQFTEEIHTQHGGEVLSKPERCPLCQQALDEDAKQRFAAFADYFLAKSRSDEATKRDAFSQARDQFRELELGEDLYRDTLEELCIDYPPLASEIQSYIQDCRAIQSFAETASSESELPGAPPVPSFDATRLGSIVDALQIHASELRAASDPERSRSLQHTAQELEAKQWLAEHRDQIKAEVRRKDRRARLSETLSDTVTTGITQKSTELTRRYVTDELCAAFSEELAKITGESPHVELAGQPGEKGVSYYRLELSGATFNSADIEPVLSEGELRAISLAAFLSELSTEETKSAVVLDDPISSLDIHNRDRLAERIAALASDRQVIVFTHDLHLLLTLLDQAPRYEIPCSTCMLEKSVLGPGVVSHDIPWEAKRFKAILGTIKQKCQTARAVASRGDVPMSHDLLANICCDLRRAVERAVEEVLLSEVVVRYRRTIHVTKVRSLAVIDQDDVRLLDQLMTRYSAFEHSQTADTRAPLPSIDQVERDVDILDQWARDFHKKART